MAPIRRYLRITRYSVLETRIYLDDPSLADSWLLNPRDPALPKVVESVRPLVLPKLREERDRERISKKNKKKAIKDVVTTDDFEVSIFLTETETRHSLLHKQKHFRSKVQTRLTSNSSKLTGSQKDAPIDLDAYEELTDVPILREESDDDDDHANLLRDVPPINETISNAPEEEEASASGSRGAKRRRGGRASSRQGGKGGSRDNAMEIDDSDEAEDEDEDGVGDGDDDGENAMFVDDSSNDDQDQDHDDEAAGRPAKRLKEHEQPAEEAAAATAQDDKKKLAMDIFYEGFAIYGRVLCLVVKRREGKGRAAARPQAIGGAAAGGGRPGGQAMMENWISSTQIPIDQGGEDAGDE